ncbi:MAG TPA: fatty acid desaturase [Pyrinomonadaceae bacterium]|nr:fatty acid desaturase [Pyrinomonadaceae bacterium]
MTSPSTFVKPGLHQLAPELFRISRARRLFTIVLPFLYVALYFVFAVTGWWPLAVPSLVALSFVTYGSISHDLVHRNLGLHRPVNDFFLSVIELLALRSGHAYRVAHLHHHARFPHTDDIEGAAARMTFPRTLLEGVIFQFKIWRWAVRLHRQERPIILFEGFGCLLLVMLGVVLYPVTPVLLVYVALMIMGSWIIPLITSYIPHDPEGESELLQTRLFRGKVLSVVALEHTYHLEHHLYPSVPHHNWPQLAKVLDPYFEAAGLKPIRLWF